MVKNNKADTFIYYINELYDTFMDSETHDTIKILSLQIPISDTQQAIIVFITSLSYFNLPCCVI